MNKLTKILLLNIVLFGLFFQSVANPVDQQTAQSVAAKFMGTSDLQLAVTYPIDKDTPALFVFNTTDGFVIVAADDCETPIIGYSREGRFKPNNVPPQMEDYLQDFVTRIQYGIEHHIEADERTAKQWEWVKTIGWLNNRKDTKSVEPLLTEMWEQGCLYNSLCPILSKLPCGHAEAGCVAVAMGQIMHHWKYPATGFGTHSYTNQGVTLSADFGNTTYDWDHMPDSLTETSSDVEIEAVSTLLFHCGVSVDMKYTANGSGADSGDVPDALIRYFNYSRRMHIEKRRDFDDEEWMSMLETCLNQQRPIFYGGRGSQGSHAFVCDGYDDNDLLHFNWGWGRANGYFALGNLNPIGYNFSNNNFAIFDIIPEYEPCIVETTVYPPTAGIIEGGGGYHVGDSCTVTAIPTEHHDFYCWKRDGQIISNNPSITFWVEEDILLEAHFSCSPIGQITANYSPEAGNPNSPSVSLSWSHADIEWIPIKQFDIQGENSVASDGECIYTCYATQWDYPLSFGKYTMNGDLEEYFAVKDDFYAFAMTNDGNYFYCGNNIAWLDDRRKLYCIDFANKRIIDSIETGMEFDCCAYDSENDGFWLSNFNLSSYKSELTLVNRQGQRIAKSPKINNSIRGTGYINAKDGNPHLLVLIEGGVVYDFDITNNRFNDNPLLVFDDGFAFGCSIGKYDGKEALFIVIGRTVHIYEVKSNLAQIIAYRIYRADSAGNVVTLADDVGESSSYTDETWENAVAGMYRFGISMVYANGVESEIIWSDYIEKTDYGIKESQDEPVESSVQKVFEDGKIVIIKGGKRYTVTGQQLN